MFRSNVRRTIDPSKDTQFSDAWIVLAVILTAVGVATDSRYLTAAAMLLLATIGLTWLWSRLSLRGVSYERRFSEIRAFRGETIELALTVRNRKPLPLTWLTARDVFPQELPVAEKQLQANPTTNMADFSTFWMPGPYQNVTRRYLVDCVERGFHDYGPVRLETGDPFGFFSRHKLMPQTQRLIVYPQLYTVADLRLPAKNPFGEAQSTGRLFEDPLRTVGIREWQETDSPRRIHWKATARRQTMLSRVYEPSEEQQVMLFLNVATLERHWHGYLPELQERTISVAGSLAALAADLRLPAGLTANGALPGSDQPIRLLPGRGPNHLVRILELLAAVTPFATAPIEQMLLQEAPRMPWGATLVVVTAIAHDDLLATIVDLAAARRKMVLFTLAKEPPVRLLNGVTVYHLPHLIDDLIAPALVQEGT
ncbi:MAG: DUF58 domain-containing protein [Caldilineaceae bacterium]|nr:DUF58 domain-containing protein [Caldilineaceae bacterium]